MHHIDQIYARALKNIPDFRFDNETARVFDNMIRRSVPGYATLVHHTTLLACRYLQPDTKIYDLGCSLGTLSLAILETSNSPKINLIAVDSSPAFIETMQADPRVQSYPELNIVCADIRNLEIHDASVIVCNFTLQFIPPEDRDVLLTKIRTGLLPGGVFILSEKITADSPVEETLMQDLFYDFKLANGYSSLEIEQKKIALQPIMRPDSISGLQQRLKNAEFTTTQTWFRCLNFISLMATVP